LGCVIKNSEIEISERNRRRARASGDIYTHRERDEIE